MNFEKITALVAAQLGAALPEENPWRGNVTAAVADPKETGSATFAVVEVTGGVRDLIPGNYTMQAECRIFGQLVPTEGGWSAEDCRTFADQLSAALVASVDELMTPAPDAEQDWLVLGVHPTGPATMEAQRGVGYVAEVPFTLTVQF